MSYDDWKADAPDPGTVEDAPEYRTDLCDQCDTPLAIDELVYGRCRDHRADEYASARDEEPEPDTFDEAYGKACDRHDEAAEAWRMK